MCQNGYMRTPLVALAFTAAVFASSPADACEGMPVTTQIGKIDVQSLAALLTSATPPTVFDANSEETRLKYGVIPQAKLLTHYQKYNVVAELPKAKDSELVFYCAAEACASATIAAQTAVDAGYKNVAVMPAGIKGWKRAGKAAVKPGAKARDRT